MFQFPWFASLLLKMMRSLSPGCPIRIPADLSVLATPRSFSQLCASFLASGSLGIPRTPFAGLLLIHYLTGVIRFHPGTPEGAPQYPLLPPSDMSPALCRSYGLPCRRRKGSLPLPPAVSQSALCSLFSLCRLSPPDSSVFRLAVCRPAFPYFSLLSKNLTGSLLLPDSGSCNDRMSRMSSCVYPLFCPLADALSRMVENNGFEPLTPCLQSRCSSQLS